MNANQERAHHTGWCMAPEGARPKHEGCPGCECACHVEAGCGYVDIITTSRRPLTCGDATYPQESVDDGLGGKAPRADNFHMPKKSP